VGHNGTANKDFVYYLDHVIEPSAFIFPNYRLLMGPTVQESVRSGSRDRLFKDSFEPDQARFQLTNFIWLHSIDLVQKTKSAGIIHMTKKLVK